MAEEKEWIPNPKATAAALERIDHAQRALPTCALCGQRTVKLDRFGLCSKVKGEHDEWRAGVRADEKTGAIR